jgi:hypothetical protein
VSITPRNFLEASNKWILLVKATHSENSEETDYYCIPLTKDSAMDGDCDDLDYCTLSSTFNADIAEIIAGSAGNLEQFDATLRMEIWFLYELEDASIDSEIMLTHPSNQCEVYYDLTGDCDLNEFNTVASDGQISVAFNYYEYDYIPDNETCYITPQLKHFFYDDSGN